jgi:hypothetical protein
LASSPRTPRGVPFGDQEAERQSDSRTRSMMPGHAKRLRAKFRSLRTQQCAYVFDVTRQRFRRTLSKTRGTLY